MDIRNHIVGSLERCDMLQHRANATSLTNFFALMHTFHLAGLWFDPARVPLAPHVLLDVHCAQQQLPQPAASAALHGPGAEAAFVGEAQ